MLYESPYLAHFGILGQKWGIRRYQNEDGTLTEEGKARYLGKDSMGLYRLKSDNKKELFENYHDFKLTKTGQKMYDKSKEDSPFRKAVDTERFMNKYIVNTNKSLRKAHKIFDPELEKINKKYEGIDLDKNSKKRREYFTELGNAWKDIYGKILLKDFGSHPQLGNDWIKKYGMFYNQYDPDWLDNRYDEEE